MNSRFRSTIVTSRYWVNGLVILILLCLPLFHIIKFDFIGGKYWLFRQETTWLNTATGFLGFWAGSYLITLIADFIFGRLFCGWICSWGTLLRTLGYMKDKTKRKHLPNYAPQAFTFFAALLSTLGLLNWFTDITDLFRISDISPGIYMTYAGIAFSLVVISYLMLWNVGLRFCQSYCPIGLYLGVISQKHEMRIDFEATNCTLGEVCVKDCPMGLDPRLLAMNTEKDNHNQCILCGDCLSSCNACAAKIPGQKPLQLHISAQPAIEDDLAAILERMKIDKTERRKIRKIAVW